MSFARRSLTSNFINLSHRFRPSFAHAVVHDDRNGCDPDRFRRPNSPFFSRSIPNLAPSIQHSRNLGIFFPFGIDPVSRFYSSIPNDRGNEVELFKGSTEILTDAMITETPAVAAAAAVDPFAGEVAAAAADSFLPIAGLQYLMDGVHSFTTLNWWACIALTTVLIRGATIPLLLHQMRATVKLNKMRPELEKLKEQLQNNMDPESMQESKERMTAVFKKHGVTPFTPLKGIFIQAPVFISFFLAIQNMVAKVPSFKGGGALWFTDLTTPDPTYALPFLTAVSFWAIVELNMQDGMEGNPMANTMKKVSRVFAVMSIPLTASFSKGIFCYWITSNIFSLVFGFAVKQQPLRKFLNLPDIVPQPPGNTSTMPSFPFFGGSKPVASAAASPLAAKVADQVKPQQRSKTKKR